MTKQVFITMNMLYDAQTYLANIEEPNTAEEWDAFDAKDFRDVVFPIDYTTKSPFIDNKECTKFWEYADATLPPQTTVESLYLFIDTLNEEIIGDLHSKYKSLSSDELLDNGIQREYKC